jgi:sugar (pentulose or hexulose) kinase
VRERAIIVLDVGKTLAKLSLWDCNGALIDRRSRSNAAVGGRLDVEGIEDWLAAVLSDFAALADVGAIIPVAHGAAAVVLHQGQRIAAPMDYEAPIPPEIRKAYDVLRDPFSETGSPALPDGLNLGAQLFHLGALPKGAQILLWPQYWAWVLSGIAASEVTSLGCHSDLWTPTAGIPSRLAHKMGWAASFPPLRLGGEILGPIRAEWAARTGLPADTQIHCGLHDSNAALVAARGFPEIADREATVLSTGTWFVAMRSPSKPIALATLAEGRDSLVNVDVGGCPIPSARFMGGREIELLGERIDLPGLDGLAGVIANQAVILPTYAPGCGPFPEGKGGWLNRPSDAHQRKATIALYTALLADTALDLIGSCERLLIEGRFAKSEVFVRALAALRPDMRVYTSSADADVSFGALRLVNPAHKPQAALKQVKPLEIELFDYKTEWHHRIKEGNAA